VSLFLVGIIIFSGWGLLRIHWRQSGGHVFYQPAQDKQNHAVRLHRREGRYILIDTEVLNRENSSGNTVFNPLLLGEEKLLRQGDGGVHDNPWLAFQGLYLDYYSSFYCRRFDRCNLGRFDREVRLAYDYWKENSP